MKHLDDQLKLIRGAITSIQANAVTDKRYQSGMLRVRDLQDKMQSQVDEQDEQIDVIKTSIALIGQTVDTYKKFVWVMIGSVVSLAGALVFWLITK